MIINEPSRQLHTRMLVHIRTLYKEKSSFKFLYSNKTQEQKMRCLILSLVFAIVLAWGNQGLGESAHTNAQ